MTIATPQRPLPSRVVGLSRGLRMPGQELREAAPSGTLIVGQTIKVKGQIESCQHLVVEGRVEAVLTAKSLSVHSGGAFKGTAEVDTADIAGDFEGTLTVHGTLSIKGGGTATGQIRYERIAIESGGKIAGDVAAEAEAEPESKAEPEAQDGAEAATSAELPASQLA